MQLAWSVCSAGSFDSQVFFILCILHDLSRWLDVAYCTVIWIATSECNATEKRKTATTWENKQVSVASNGVSNIPTRGQNDARMFQHSPEMSLHRGQAGSQNIMNLCTSEDFYDKRLRQHGAASPKWLPKCAQRDPTGAPNAQGTPDRPEGCPNVLFNIACDPKFRLDRELPQIQQKVLMLSWQLSTLPPPPTALLLPPPTWLTQTLPKPTLHGQSTVSHTWCP